MSISCTICLNWIIVAEPIFSLPIVSIYYYWFLYLAVTTCHSKLHGIKYLIILTKCLSCLPLFPLICLIALKTQNPITFLVQNKIWCGFWSAFSIQLIQLSFKTRLKGEDHQACPHLLCGHIYESFLFLTVLSVSLALVGISCLPFH